MPILRSVSPKPVSPNYSALPPIALIHWSPQTLINARGNANSCTWSFWGLSSQVGIFEQWQKLPKMTKIAENDKNQRKWHTLPKMTKNSEYDKKQRKGHTLPKMKKIAENDKNDKNCWKWPSPYLGNEKSFWRSAGVKITRFLRACQLPAWVSLPERRKGAKDEVMFDIFSSFASL